MPSAASPPKASVVVAAQYLILLRARIAPTGSFRHRFLRLLYIPLVGHLAKRERTIASHDVVGRVVPLQASVAQRGGWPARPRILVLKLDHLGDFIVSLPALAHLRQAFPDALITLCCASWTRAWAEQSGLADRVVTFDFFTSTNAEWSGPSAELYDRFAELNLGPFELAIDLRHDPDTRPLLARVEAEVRAGFAAPVDKGGRLLDIALPDMEHVSVAFGTGRPAHAALRLSMLAAAVSATFAPPVPHPVKRILKHDGVPLRPAGPYLILAPAAGSPIRRWPVARLAEVGRKMAAMHGLSIALIGGPGDVEACRAVAAALPEDATLNLAGRMDVADLPGLIQQCQLFVGLDSGTSHLAASLGVSTVVVMGAVGNPEVWRAIGPNAIVLSTEIPCSGCYFTVADQCPHGVRCLDVISTEHVLDACDTVLRWSRKTGQVG